MNHPGTIKCFCCDLNWTRFDLHAEFGDGVRSSLAHASLGYAWGTPPEFRPHPSYESDLRIVSNAFHEIG